MKMLRLFRSISDGGGVGALSVWVPSVGTFPLKANVGAEVLVLGFWIPFTGIIPMKEEASGVGGLGVYVPFAGIFASFGCR